MIFKKIIILCFFLIQAYAESKELPPIKFAGIWVRGNAVDAKKSCPVGYQYALSANPSEKAIEYTQKIHAALVKDSKADGIRIMDHIAELDYMPNSAVGRAYVMACALKYEILEAGTLPSGNRGAFAEIGFDLIICDFSDRSVVLSIPCRLVIQDHGEKNIKNMIALYDQHLPGLFSKISEEQWNPGIIHKSIGITSTVIRLPEDIDDVPENMVGVPKQLLGKHQEISSHIAASRLYDQTGIPVQPFSVGEEALFYGLRENLVNAPDLRSKQIIEQINGNGFVLKKPNYEMSISGAYFRRRDKNFEFYICMYRMIVKTETGDEIFNDIDQAASDGIPFKYGNPELLWHYQADATVRMFEKFAGKLRAERNKGNANISFMWNDLTDSRKLK
jgi:hypothetical protein